jgi:hypothetical protein
MRLPTFVTFVDSESLTGALVQHSIERISQQASFRTFQRYTL